MQDFKPVGDMVGYGTECLMTYDANMGVSPLYTYYVEDSGLAPEGDGWYDEDGAKADVTFSSGNGCVYQSAGDPLQYSGSVPKGAIPIIDLYDGFTCIGNASPVQKTMQDFKPIGDMVGYGTECLMTYDENMAVSPLYTYYVEDSGLAPEGDGWYDEEGLKADVTFEPGDGFVIQCAGDCTLEITKVID